MSIHQRLQRLTTTRPNHVVDINLRYSLGGTSFATYQARPRGYYLSVQPVELDGIFEKFVGFTGMTTCVEPAARFNRRRFDSLAQQHATSTARTQLLNAVLVQQGLTLAAAATPA